MVNRRVIPGFGLSMGYTLFYLSLLVMVPLAALCVKTAQLSWGQFWGVVTDANVVAAFRLSFWASIIAAVVNAVFGLIVAWVLVRYTFPGRRVLDALVDFPFALPTAVAGLTFGQLLSTGGWLGSLGDRARWALNWVPAHAGLGDVLGPDSLGWLNLRLMGTNAGVVVVLIFVGLPFVVRTVQPVLQDWEVGLEQAAHSLGAGRWRTFWRVVFPELYPAWLSGLALAFARAIGEYGSVVFIAANKQGESQIAPLAIMEKLDEFEYAKATAIGVVLLGVSLVVLLLINGLEWWSRRHER